MGWSENCASKAVGIGELGSRQWIVPGLPLKLTLSVLRSSRFRSTFEPAPRLNGAEVPYRKRGESFNLPNHHGVSNVPVIATRCRLSCKVLAHSRSKSPFASALAVLFSPSSNDLEYVY